jgi:hypothetical protein
VTSPTSSFDTLISEKAREIRRGFDTYRTRYPPINRLAELTPAAWATRN